MTSSHKNIGRYAAAPQPKRPFNSIAQAVSENAGVVGRKTVVVAASSGLFASLFAAGPAQAETANNALNEQATPVTSVDASNIAAKARQAIATAPVVETATDAVWATEVSNIEVVAAPEPEPVPVVVETRSTQATSRSNARTAIESTTTQSTTANTATEVQQSVQSVNIPASVDGNAVLEIASRYVGVPYVSGGSTPSGFDCSGFTSYVYAQLGISLPRTSGAQKSAGVVVSRDQAQPGDLIWSPGHIAIYAGGNQQFDAPRPGKTVQFREIWQSNPVFIRVAQ